MTKPMLKLIAVALLGLFGDSAHLWRGGVCLLAGAGLTVLAYAFWPTVLPLWPGAVMMSGAVAVGVLWEWRAAKAEDATLK